MLFIQKLLGKRRFSPKNPPPGFYHYLYLRKDGTPYYSGKGKDGRAWCKRHAINLPTDPSLIIITHWGLTELWAFALERCIFVGMVVKTWALVFFVIELMAVREVAGLDIRKNLTRKTGNRTLERTTGHTAFEVKNITTSDGNIQNSPERWQMAPILYFPMRVERNKEPTLREATDII